MTVCFGRSPLGRASRPADQAAARLGDSATIPNAPLRYEFFTPYFRGFDLVWDFLCAQNGSFSDGILTVKGSYGHERARDLRLLADEQQIGSGAELWERFAPLSPVFHAFWHALERAATDWRDEKDSAEARAGADSQLRDEKLCAKILASHAIATEAAKPTRRKAGSARKGDSAGRKASPKGS